MLLIGIFLTITILTTRADAECSTTTGIIVNTTVPRIPKPERTGQKTHAIATKYSATFISSVFRLKVTATYCPAVELSIFEDCKRNSGVITFREHDWIFDPDTKSCVGPSPCDQGVCDNWEEESCLRYSNHTRVKLGSKTEGRFSQSWLYHRCVRALSCEYLESNPTIQAVKKGVIAVIHPELGACITKVEEKWCCWETGHCIMFKIASTTTPEPVSLTCLSGESGSYCLIGEEKQIILITEEDDNVLGDTYYQLGDAFSAVRRGRLENPFGIPNTRSLEAMFDTVEYQALQEEVLETINDNRIAILEKMMVMSVKTGGSGVESYMLNRYGLIVKLKNVTGDLLFLFVCGHDKQSIPQNIADIQWTSINLFEPHEKTSALLAHPIIESYKYYSSGSEVVYPTNLVIPLAEEKQSNSVWGWGLLAGWLSKWFIKGTCIAFWICLVARR